MKTWSDISANKEFQSLTKGEQAMAASYFFDKHIAPNVGDADVAEAQQYFMDKAGLGDSGYAAYSGEGQETSGNRVYDTGLDVAKGAVSLGQSAVGLASMATGGLVGKGMRYLGYDPK
ncbi:MAG: hypothetical protein R8M45_05525, partial [Ghiorsea sp.]